MRPPPTRTPQRDAASARRSTARPAVTRQLLIRSTDTRAGRYDMPPAPPRRLPLSGGEGAADRRRRERRDRVAVRLEQLVHEACDVVEGEFCGGVGVEHRRVVHRLAAAGQGGLDGQALDVDVGLYERGELAGEGADALWLDPPARRDARHFDAAVGGQVVDQLYAVEGVRDVAV